MRENLGLTKSIYRYWGKADPDYPGEPKWHPLAYHCLDVAAVAAEWLEGDEALRNCFARRCSADESRLKAWLLFFIALHDLGKFDVRFQLKAKDIALSLNPLFSEADTTQANDFDHGRYGRYWFSMEQGSYGFQGIDDAELHQWISAVCGHHGRGFGLGRYYSPNADEAVIEHDRQARAQWVELLKDLFLKPAGIASFEQLPASPGLLAGFCSVCDWLGSNTDFFPYTSETNITPHEYFYGRKEKAVSALKASGMLGKAAGTCGMAALFPDYTPKGVQLLIDKLHIKPGLTLIEAPTGSGKTEAALAYASRLLAAGLGDSIIFALPTQATANGMLERLEKVGRRLFQDGANVVLAHGKARYNSAFINLQKIAAVNNAQGGEEAFAQCAKWLATSRKRVFLGQIGVCTIDQVLLSVLPIRHHFVRAFGIRKGILIVDEIHAYDSYMNGLLDLVLKAQRRTDGSAILLSATLPASRRSEIFRAWGNNIPATGPDAPYPLVTHASTEVETMESPEPVQPRSVEISALQGERMMPPDELMDEISSTVEKGARVVVICNLVKDAQKLARQLIGERHLVGDLFHSRFRFLDRQRIEKRVLEHYGKESQRDRGSVLIATQVVEQSLDIDFDMMITQLCPVDLLFQRIGRLHRHDIARPSGFERPRCTILIPTDGGYGLHALIYGDERVLWRTQKLLEKQQFIPFPQAYREWIEVVYSEDEWPDEPKEMTEAHTKYRDEEDGRRHAALSLGNADASPLADTDGNVSALTRDGEMSLNVIPILLDGRRRLFLEGTPIDEIPEWERDEALNMNTVPVPHNWKRLLPDDEEGLIFLPMKADGQKVWKSMDGKFRYSTDFGLEKEDK